MTSKERTWPGWLGGGATIEVPCTVEIERSFDSFHAYAVPEGIELRPGDRVVVHGAPDHVDFGESMRFETRATVYRAGPLTRLWTQWVAIFELTELYHCGFEPKEAAPWPRWSFPPWRPSSHGGSAPA